MARKHRQPAGLRRYWAARRAKTNKPRRKYHARAKARTHSKRRTSYAINRPRRKSRVRHYFRKAYRAVRQRHYKTNPSLMGFQLPGLMDIAAVGAGFVVPPILAGYVMGWLPDSLKTSKVAFWTVKAASVLVPSLVVRRFVSRRAGSLMLLGGAVSFVMDLVKEFAPGVIPGLGYQPLLGAFIDRPLAIAARRASVGAGQRNILPPMIASTPDRLSPASRF
jgi:hypothetical protein